GAHLPQMRRAAPYRKAGLRRPDLCCRRPLQEAPHLAAIPAGAGVPAMQQGHNVVRNRPYRRGLTPASCPTPPPRGGDSLLTVLRRCAIMLLAIVTWRRYV